MHGIVKKIDDESVFVEIDQMASEECSSCTKCGKGCTDCSSKPKEKTVIECKLASDELTVEVGEEVNVEINPNKKIASSSILFLVPIAALLGSFKLSLFFTKNEIINAICAIAGFLLSVFIIVTLFKNSKIKDTFKPIVTKKNF